MTRLIHVLSVIAAFSVPGLGIADSPVFIQSKIKYLSPRAIEDLPPDIVQALTLRGCKIPEIYPGKHRVNVITGSFADPAQMDWALLCSIDGISHLQMIWGGDAKCASEMASSPDDDWFQVQDEDAAGRKLAGFARMIWRISPEEIIEARDLGRLPPEFITHDAVYNGYEGKHGVAFFCSQGQWYELQDKF